MVSRGDMDERHGAGRTRREAIGVLAGGVVAMAAERGRAQPPGPGAPPCPDAAAIDAATAPLLALLPEAVLRAGLPGGDPARCDDPSPAGDDAIALAVAAALPRLPAGCAGATASARAVLERWGASRDAGYGRNDPLAAIHRPYRVSPYAGPHLDTPEALALWQPLDTPDAIEAWLAKLDHFTDALLGAGQGLRADEAAGCVPTQATGRAVLAQMDDFVLTPGVEHPLVAALRARIADPALAGPAAARATATLTRRVQPAMASLRDTVAALTRKARIEPGLWSLPRGEALYAANLTRAGDTAIGADEAQAWAREEAHRAGALLDRRLTARGYRTGTLAERIAAAFAAHPGLVAADDGSGRAALLAAARDRIGAAHALLGKIVPPALATTAAPAVAPIPELGRAARSGSFYLPAGTAREAVLWLDTRSVWALPVPGVAPLAVRLGLPGEHLLAAAARTEPRPAIVAAAQWPALTAGWGAYAERLAAEAGLFARDPWGDIARLSDAVLRAARLVVDIGLHAQRWTRVQAEQAMIEMTGAAQGPVIDRIVAMPGEAAGAALGLRRLVALREEAEAAGRKGFDARGFHAAVLTGGPRPFAAVAV